MFSTTAAIDNEKRKLEMKKALAAGVFLCVVLAGCGGGGTTQSAPAVTQVVTQTATATVTATPAPAAVVPPAAEPAPVVPAAPAPVAPTTALIPANVAGMNAEALDDDLTALGFKKVIYNSDTGKTVLLLSNWTVTGIDGPGSEQSVDRAVVVHVTK
jgi:hypothetical protein